MTKRIIPKGHAVGHTKPNAPYFFPTKPNEPVPIHASTMDFIFELIDEMISDSIRTPKLNIFGLTKPNAPDPILTPKLNSSEEPMEDPIQEPPLVPHAIEAYSEALLEGLDLKALLGDVDEESKEESEPDELHETSSDFDEDSPTVPPQSEDPDS